MPLDGLLTASGVPSLLRVAVAWAFLLFVPSVRGEGLGVLLRLSSEASAARATAATGARATPMVRVLLHAYARASARCRTYAVPRAGSSPDSYYDGAELETAATFEAGGGSSRPHARKKPSRRQRKDEQELRRSPALAGFPEAQSPRERSAELFARGATQAEVARQLGVTRQSAMRWQRAFEKGGADALRPCKRGRRARVSSEQLEQLTQILLKEPQGRAPSQDCWTLERVGILMRRLFGVSYHPGHVWRILRSLGWSHRRAPRARARGVKRIEGWKKQAVLRVRRGEHRARSRAGA